MAPSKRRGSGRVTPKGTTDPAVARKATKAVPPAPPGAPPPARDRVGGQRTKPLRPITHHRGNR